MPIGYCINKNLIGTQWIIEDNFLTNKEALKFINNNDYAKFYSNFKHVKLPFIFKSKRINYNKWNDIPQNFIDKYLDKLLVSIQSTLYPRYISEEFVAETPIITNKNIEIKNTKFFYSPILNNNFSAVIYIYKFYDDKFRRKSTYAWFTTFDKNGNPISNIKIGEETILYNKKNKKIFELYTMASIDKQYNIEYKELIWQFSSEGYGTSGYRIPIKYTILDNGAIEKVKDIKINRDE